MVLLYPKHRVRQFFNLTDDITVWGDLSFVCFSLWEGFLYSRVTIILNDPSRYKDQYLPGQVLGSFFCATKKYVDTANAHLRENQTALSLDIQQYVFFYVGLD